MTSRKRGRQEMETSIAPAEPSMLERIRNMWEFANLAQYLFIFGKAVKVEDDVVIEDLEAECLTSGGSQKLTEIGLALLKFVSSHRGLTLDVFEEHTRRQYRSKLPDFNPFGDDEIATKFDDLDAFTKIRVLFQLSQWTMMHSDKIRERMPEQKDSEQTYWRIEPTGWDSRERTYFVLDDNRLYRVTEPPPSPPPALKAKKNSKKFKAAQRANKRRKLSSGADPNVDESANEAKDASPLSGERDRYGGRKWELVALTLDQYRMFLDSMRKSKDADEKILYQSITENILPVVEKAEESLQRKAAKKQRECLALEKLATAKRSSRIAGKMERQQEEEAAVEAEKRKRTEMVVAKKEQVKMKKMEEERENRIVTREARVREREMKRILHEAELANLSEETKKLESGEGRLSERHLKVEMEKRRKALEELEEEAGWMFDCSGCGVHGENLDDGTGIVSCEDCSVWQHLSCLGLNKDLAEDETFHFICVMCERRQADKEKSAKNPIKLDFRKLGSSASPPSEKKAARRPHETDILPQLREDDRQHRQPAEGSRSPSPGKRVKGETGALPSASTLIAPMNEDGNRNNMDVSDLDGVFRTKKDKNSNIEGKHRNNNIMNGPELRPAGQYGLSPSPRVATAAALKGSLANSPILPPSLSGNIPPKALPPPPSLVSTTAPLNGSLGPGIHSSLDATRGLIRPPSVVLPPSPSNGVLASSISTVNAAPHLQPQQSAHQSIASTATATTPQTCREKATPTVANPFLSSPALPSPSGASPIGISPIRNKESFQANKPHLNGHHTVPIPTLSPTATPTTTTTWTTTSPTKQDQPCDNTSRGYSPTKKSSPSPSPLRTPPSQHRHIFSDHQTPQPDMLPKNSPSPIKKTSPYPKDGDSPAAAAPAAAATTISPTGTIPSLQPTKPTTDPTPPKKLDSQRM